MPIQVLFRLEYGHGRFQAVRLAPLTAKAPVVEPRAVNYLSDLRLKLFVPLAKFGGEGPRELNSLRE